MITKTSFPFLPSFPSSSPFPSHTSFSFSHPIVFSMFLSPSSSSSSLLILPQVHALTSPAPKYRYRVGKDSKYLFTILENLHESNSDWYERVIGYRL